jgi:EamA domain-containing membrane protein RarD
MSHRKAVWVMVAATLMWSIAGVVSRHLQAARSFEVTFWRSAFNALALVVMLSWLRGPAVLWQTLRTAAWRCGCRACAGA